MVVSQLRKDVDIYAVPIMPCPFAFLDFVVVSKLFHHFVKSKAAFRKFLAVPRYCTTANGRRPEQSIEYNFFYSK